MTIENRREVNTHSDKQLPINGVPNLIDAHGTTTFLVFAG